MGGVMANGPNKTVAAWRNARWSEVKTVQVAIRDQDATQAELRAEFPGPRYSVRKSSYAIGPRGAGQRAYVVRVYDRGEPA